MKNLLPSKKQHALLEFIDGFIKKNEYAPSYREVARALDYKSVSTVAIHINGLIERGWLVKRDNAKRSIEVTYQLESDAVPDPNQAAKQWLKTLVANRLNDPSAFLTADERAQIVQGLALLGLADITDETT